MGVLDLFKLDGKKAYVTGGGQGIGRGYALALAEAGADVAIVDINPDTAKKVADEVTSLGRRGIAVQTDVTKSEKVKKMIETILSEFGRIDIAVNNAGIGSWAPAEDMPEEDWDRVIDLNMKGIFLSAQAAGKVMIKQGGGKIINTASMSASIVNRPQEQVAYNASKAGVVMTTKSMAAEWAEFNINVNSISPGYTRTFITDQVKEHHNFWKSLTPMARLGEVDDLRGVIIFLASDASNFMTGQDLIIDGGYTLW